MKSPVSKWLPAVVVALFILATATSCSGLFASAAPPGDGVVQGWAVLAEKDDYTGLGVSLMVDYINIIRMRQMLEDSGWDPDQILDLREFDRDALQDGLDWLEENADGDDVVLIYVTGHGNYISNETEWYEFFADEWKEIPSHRRLLIIDACRAAQYTREARRGRGPYMSIASVDTEEYAWCGLEVEGLPIIGGVFTYYFTAAFGAPSADTDGDGFVSVQEAALLAETQQRTYMHDVVFAVPRFLEDFHGAGIQPEQDPDYPHVVVDDRIDVPLYLTLDAYR